MKMKWLALVTAAALGLTACGNKDKQASAPAPDAPAQTASGNTADTPAPADNRPKKPNPWFLQVISWLTPLPCKLQKMR